MTCKRFGPLLGQLVDGELDSGQRVAVKEHLKSCLDCRRAFQELLALTQLARKSKKPPEVPEGYWDELPDRVLANTGLPATAGGKRQPAGRSRRIPIGHFGWAMAAAAVLVSAFLMGRGVVERTIQLTTIGDEIPALSEGAPARQPEAAPEAVAVLNQEKESSSERAAAPELQGAESGLASKVEPSAGPETGEDRLALGSRGRSESVQRTASPPDNTGGVAAPGRAAMPVETERSEVAAQAETLLQQRISQSVMSEGRTLGKADAPGKPVPGRFRDALPARPIGTVAASEIPSTYAAALWLSQTAATVEDRERIWLSFLETQPDSVYRNLALARLAETLVETAQADKDSSRIERTLRFLETHRKELLEVLGPKYEDSVNRLRMLRARAGPGRELPQN